MPNNRRSEQEEFEAWLRARLNEVAAEIEPRDILPEIQEAIRRHQMPANEYVVRITQREDAPEDWPFEEIQLTVNAGDEEEAEDIAEGLISLIQSNRNVQRAMTVDEVFESALCL